MTTTTLAASVRSVPTLRTPQGFLFSFSVFNSSHHFIHLLFSSSLFCCRSLLSLTRRNFDSMQSKTSLCSASYTSCQCGTAPMIAVAPVLLRRCRCLAPSARQLSIDVSCSSGAQQQTGRTLLQRSIYGTDRQTDRRTDTGPFHRPCFVDYAGSGNKLSNRHAIVK